MRNSIILLSVAALTLTACVPKPTVRQSDLDAWVGKPVAALDTHSFFLTLPLRRSYTEDGTIELRNYVNEGTVLVSSGGAMAEARIGCHNLFYIEDGYVVEYRPTWRGPDHPRMGCRTDERVRPQPPY